MASAESDRPEQPLVPPFSADSLRFALDHMDPQERTEFNDGVSKYFYRLQIEPGQMAQQAFLAYVRSWVVSIVLREDDEWQAEMVRTATIPADAEEPVDINGLRALLGV